MFRIENRLENGQFFVLDIDKIKIDDTVMALWYSATYHVGTIVDDIGNDEQELNSTGEFVKELTESGMEVDLEFIDAVADPAGDVCVRYNIDLSSAILLKMKHPNWFK